MERFDGSKHINKAAADNLAQWIWRGYGDGGGGMGAITPGVLDHQLPTVEPPMLTRKEVLQPSTVPW